MDLDKLPIARGAEFNSYMDQHEDECLPGTRTKLLHQIAEWAVSPQGKCIFWLNGMAGTGKSTISRTVANSFKQEKLLGACFFFKRGEGDRGNAIKMFPTITRQLLSRLPQLIPGVRKATQNDPDIATKSLKEQFNKLLLQPLVGLIHSDHRQTIVIVIDALDECELDNDIRAILQLLPQLQGSSAVRVRVFLTSRPELPIRLGFSEITNHDYQDLALHEISEAVTEHDISLFLKDRFRKIRDKTDVPPDWPGDDNVRTLVTMSVPLFISAATVCRFVEDPKWEPAVRLAEILEGQAKYATKMDKTYLPILTRLVDDQDDDESEQLLQQFQEIVGVIILLAVPLSVNTLSQFLGIRAGLISKRLDSFQSVLSIPGNRDVPVRILHLSFRDFLIDTKTMFYVDKQRTHKNIALHCLAIMCCRLKRDICNLESYGTRRTEIDTQSIDQRLPTELRYSCRYWAHHLVESKDLNSMTHNALLFLQKHFLHWVEAMSILGLTSEIVRMIDRLQPVIRVSYYRSLI